MAGPSNIRINPFTGTGGATNYVELTEKHIIPSVSPYVIRLNEVPEKQDPSNMKMVYVDSATGAATENTLTEVAATPGQGEFRPDYSTNAMEDKTWNTGLVEFSASDAGKIVQVTYTGTGTLAGVTSNHWPSWYTDRGDGSDGDFVPTENTTISGVKNYKSVFIKAGVTVTIDKYALIKCQDAFINEGTITGEGMGAKGGTGGKSSSSQVVVGGDGSNGYISNGGAAGKYSNYLPLGGTSFYRLYGLSKEDVKNIAETVLPISFYGSGGGGGIAKDYTSSSDGGNGGAGICILTNTFSSNTIKMSGGNGVNGVSAGAGTGSGSSGGGGGGAVIIIASSVVKQGDISVNGGKGGTNGITSSYANAANGEDGFYIVKELGV